MTPQEIKAEMARQGLSAAQVASDLCINVSSFRQMLAGTRKMTQQTARHIELLLGRRKQQILILTVELPDGACEALCPGFDALPEKSQKQVVEAAAKRLADIGKAALSSEELKKLRNLVG